MTADVELLPLPAEIRARDFKWASVEVYARACVEHHTAHLRYALDNAARDIKTLRGVRDAHAAEIEALRAEVRTLVRQNGEWQARAERLAEALGLAMDWNWLDEDARPSRTAEICDAALEQENGRG